MSEMKFSPWLEGIYAKVSAGLDVLPQWKKDALAMDEAFLEQKRKEERKSR